MCGLMLYQGMFLAPHLLICSYYEWRLAYFSQILLYMYTCPINSCFLFVSCKYSRYSNSIYCTCQLLCADNDLLFLLHFCIPFFQYYLTIPYVFLCRYISALIDDGEQASLQQAVDRGWPASLHLIGKVCSKHFLQHFEAFMLLYCGLLFSFI